MKYCKKCVMPDTRPGSIFDDEGVCLACRNHEKRSSVKWQTRLEQLKRLCDKHRRSDGYYDCVIPVSGGKDSHFLTYEMTVEMGMNPLVITVGDPFTKTAAGVQNLNNLGEAFGRDRLLFDVSKDLFRRVTKIGAEELGEPLRFIEAAIYIVPTTLAVALRIPLIIFGENGAYEYGNTEVETYSALDAIVNKAKAVNVDFWIDRGVGKEEINALNLPATEEMERVSPEPIFMSYFMPWDGRRHYETAKRFGFRDLAHEWKREGNIEDYDQVDSVAYIVHSWMKYPKFGFARATDIACRWIRAGRITREEAKKLVMDYDHKLDQRAMEDFNQLLGYTTKEFWDVVERFWNPELFEKDGVVWKLRNPVYKDEQ